MILRQTFSKAIHGYWDGGPKKQFDWKIGRKRGQDQRGDFIEVGSFDANSWFMVAEGKTEKQILGYAKVHLRRVAEKVGETCTFEYIDE